MISQPVVPHMPMCGDHGSPQFNPEKPHELCCFFEDLKFHFMWSHIVDKEEMKQHALQFVDCDTTELWEILPEFTNATASYQKFVNAMYKLYLGLDAERRWSIGDMEKFVGEASRVGISSLANLGKNHREFIIMTTFLIAKNHISATERSQAFARGFPQKLWMKVAHRLQLKFPDHFPDYPYILEQIHNATWFILHSTASLSLALDDTCTPTLTMAPVAALSVT